MAALRDHLRQRDALDVLHHQKRRLGAVPLGAQGGVDRRHGGVAETLQHRRLPLEQLVRLPATGRPGVEDLERHEAVEPEVPGQQRAPEGTLPEWADDLVAIGDQRRGRGGHPRKLPLPAYSRETGRPYLLPLPPRRWVSRNVRIAV